jgi:hypothetical protein
MLFARRIVIIITLCGASITIYYSTLFARADSLRRKNTLESLRASVLLVPGNAENQALLAEHEEAAGLNPDKELALATSLSPRESRFWIRRAFRAEVEQKFPESEQFLRQAEKVDTGFEPRSALMNYYFRRQNAPEFWKAAEAALRTAYTDRGGIYRLCFAVDGDIAKTRAVLPPGHAPLVDLLAFLMKSDRMEPAADVAAEVASGATAEDVSLLAGYVDRQIGKNDPSALAVWNAMCERHLLPFSVLSPERGAIVTNSDFSGTLQRAFDWRFRSANGAAVSPAYTGGQSVELNGKQPESIILMEQKIPVAAGKTYSISWEYQLEGASGDSGLRWLIQKGAAGQAPRQAPVEASTTFGGAGWRTGQLTFTASDSGVDRLQLEYRRAPETIRWKGTLQLRRVSATVADVRR